MTRPHAHSIPLAEHLVAALRVATPSQPPTLVNVRPQNGLVELKGKGKEMIVMDKKLIYSQQWIRESMQQHTIT